MLKFEAFSDLSNKDAPVRGHLHPSTNPGANCLILTHGAGANCDSLLLRALFDAFGSEGWTVLRCDLPFRQLRPHGPPSRGSAERDQAGLRAAVAAMRRLGADRIVLGGHSYGGRQASMLAAAEPQLVESLLLLSYPLHPPKKPAELRTKHFPSLEIPALFVHGTRDGFGTIPEMHSALGLIPARTDLLPISGAGHELLTKSNRETLIEEVMSRFLSWFADLSEPNLMTPRKKTSSDPAKAVDRQLARYRAMRDFNVTGEPRGGGTGRSPKAAESLPFVVQKHAARQLHYDFRLGWRGVLKSWAIAKGPSYFPGDKRLAVEVEDHPMEYGGFEGTIPKGQYGGGTVMVWDFGDWQPLGDVDRQLEKGDLKFILNGNKLKGKWVLVRMRKNPDRDRSNKPNWLLIKERDEYIQPENAPAVTDLAPDSALTERTMEQIAESCDHVWDSTQGLREPKSDGETLSENRTRRTTARNAGFERLLRSAPKEKFPGFIAPQLAEEARSAPDGRNWVHELKLDGYRIQVHLEARTQGGGNVAKAHLFTRKGLDWTARMPSLARAAAELAVESVILDGEIVVLDSSGRSSFPDLQAAFQNGSGADMVYFAFDLLHLNGRNLRGLPLIKRKEILEKLLSQTAPGAVLRFCEHIRARGDVVFRKASELGAEGIVSKLITAPYTSGRGNTWLKMKAKIKQEFVIGGFSPVAKTGRGIGSLLLGVYDGGELLYAGRCGTGFSHELERKLRVRLDALAQKTPNFAAMPREARQGAIWVKPELVAQVAFAGWTKDNLIRQSSFKSLREDKPATEVVREPVFMRDAPSHEAVPHAISATVQANDKIDLKQNVALGITHPRKVLDEESGMTKQDLAEYYLAVADRMLPHVSDRPLSVLRCPDGIGKQAFFQKHVSAGLPNSVHTVSIANKKTGKHEEFLTLNSAEGLVGMAQMGVLEIHPWGSKNQTVDQPDRIIFDLDPDEAIPWKTLADAADELRLRLKELKLTSYVKSTGGKGLHVVAPIEPNYEWPVVKDFSHRVVLRMEKENSELYTTNMLKAVRKKRIYLDYLRNDREATAIAPFSTRARPGVPVAVTLDWKELRSAVRPAFHVSDLGSWRQRLCRDPWRGLHESRQRLTQEMLDSMGVKLAER